MNSYVVTIIMTTTTHQQASLKREHEDDGAADEMRQHKKMMEEEEMLPEEAFGIDEEEMMMEEGRGEDGMMMEVEDTLGEAGKNWMRPEPKMLSQERDNIVFQQFELDYTSGAPCGEFYPTAERHELQEVPVLRMFGVNNDGRWLLKMEMACFLK